MEYSILLLPVLQALCDFLKQSFSDVRISLSVNVHIRPLFLFSDDAFSWLVCADITLETGAVYTPK
jgi:hypothetical protein